MDARPRSAHENRKAGEKMNVPSLEMSTISRRINLPLFIGIMLIVVILLLAVKGPDWAPRDPLKMTSILQVGDHWEVPPYSFLTPGFPLGSDQFGRDLLSQLMWAVRPTMILVLIVAGVRLLIGMLLGLVTGWSDGWYSRMIDIAIAFGLAVPVLLVSLIVIARMGLRYGIWTFIIGLSVTGWAETAQYARDHTQLIKEQNYIEASFALGSTSAQILRQHILRQIIPLLSMLAVFEISATLMVTAELGFLGFFLGGGIFVQFDEFTVRAGYGMPELGQMLAAGLDLTTEPFGLVAAGTVIFITILGFNFIGEGLRRRLSLQRVRRRTTVDDLRDRFGLWFDEYISYPMGNFSRSLWGRLAWSTVLVFIIVVVAGYFLPEEKPRSGSNVIAETPLLPIAATDVSGSSPSLKDAETPTMPSEPNTEVVWQFPTNGVPVPPVIGEDGTVYLLTHENILYVLESDGSLRWQQELSPPPYEIESFGAPITVIPPHVSFDGRILIIAADSIYALGEGGQKLWSASLENDPKQEDCCNWNPQHTEFYLIDQRAGLHAFSIENGLLWKYIPGEDDITPRSKPIPDSNGRIYYSASGRETSYLYAVGNSGEELWVNKIPEEKGSEIPSIEFDFGYSYLRLNPREDLLFFNQDIFDAINGSKLESGVESQLPELALETGSGVTDTDRLLRFFSEKEGRTYLVTSDPIIAEVQIQSGNTQFIRARAFHEYFVGLPADRMGVAGNRYLWMEYETFPFAVGPSDERGLGILWMDLESSDERTLFVKEGEETVIARDDTSARYYLCSAQRDPALVNCRSESIKGSEDRRQIVVEGISSIKYARLDLKQDRLYIFGRDNILYVVDSVSF